MANERPIYTKAKVRPQRNPLKIGALIFMGFLVLSYILITVYFRNRYLPGTWIGDNYVTGMTVGEAEELLQTQTVIPSISVVDADGNVSVVTLDRVSYSVSFDRFLKDIRSRQVPLLWIGGLLKQSDYRPGPEYAYDSAALEMIWKGLPAVAAASGNDTGYRIEYSEEEGYTLFNGKADHFESEEAYKSFELAISQRKETFDLGKFYSTKPLSETEEETRALWEKLDRFLNCDLVYDMGGEQIVFDRKTMSGFLQKDSRNLPLLTSDGSLCLDRSAVDAYVHDLCAKYNTYGHREFRTTRGDLVTVEGGTYGTELDAEAEKEFLRESLMKPELHDGVADPHIPVYLREGVVRGLDDIGPDYVEVDMLEQKMYFYLGGELFLESDVVTGNARRKMDTPEGTDYIYYMQRNRNLVGPNYVSFVRYWMAIIDHIGLHDASWRDTFGGEIYKTSGSHGCINLPTDAAKTLYENAWVGMPVIVHN